MILKLHSDGASLVIRVLDVAKLLVAIFQLSCQLFGVFFFHLAKLRDLLIKYILVVHYFLSEGVNQGV